MNQYRFTHEQLVNTLESVIALFIEYNQQHGFEEELASAAAVNELLQGMAEERDLILYGELQATKASHTLVAS